jgi:hypothetical protein
VIPVDDVDTTRTDLSSWLSSWSQAGSHENLHPSQHDFVSLVSNLAALRLELHRLAEAARASDSMDRWHECRQAFSEIEGSVRHVSAATLRLAAQLVREGRLVRISDGHDNALAPPHEIVPAARLVRWTTGLARADPTSEYGRYPVYGNRGLAGYCSEFLIERPTVIVVRNGSRAGSTFRTSGPAWILDNAIFAIYLSPRLSLPYAEIVFETIADSDRDRGVRTVNQAMLNGTRFALPPLTVQRENVRRFRSVLRWLEDLSEYATRAMSKTPWAKQLGVPSLTS